jgi:hypothetical protein
MTVLKSREMIHAFFHQISFRRHFVADPLFNSISSLFFKAHALNYLIINDL